MGARGKKHPWSVGDVFLVPLKDGSHCPGQIVGREPGLFDCAAIALFDRRGTWNESTELGIDDVFSKLFVSRDFLDSGQWPVVHHRPAVLSGQDLPNEELRASRYVGAKVRGSEIVQEFVDAFYGLMPWDDWYI
ncbi:MAG: Imm26 family immunity protein, partial [Pseudoxanthomonas sp.]|nr:Imm26 family immunity protein [Pseudoxanthomonas sp.]